MTGRLVVRRIPDLKAKKPNQQAGLFDLWRFHAFFTTTPSEQADTVSADKIHRHHAIIENVHADLKHSALAHLPSGKLAANAAPPGWCWPASLSTSPELPATISGDKLARASTATIRRTLINVPARTATSGRRVTLHLPTNWPWQPGWDRLFTSACGPPVPASS